MENDTLLTVGIIGIGAFAAYKILNDLGGGIKATGDAAGSIATDAATTAGGIFKDVNAVTSNTQSGINQVGTDAQDTHDLFKQDAYGIYTEAKTDAQQLYGAAKGFFSSVVSIPGSIAGSVGGMFSPTPTYTAIPGVNYTQAPANFSSITGQAIYVPPPTVTTPKPGGAAMFTPAPASYTPAKTGGSTPAPIGAKVGTIFAGGASVKSTGASGKYRTTL
jgi:hypothetical protein